MSDAQPAPPPAEVADPIRVAATSPGRAVARDPIVSRSERMPFEPGGADWNALLVLAALGVATVLLGWYRQRA